jgi:hypothetical protein
MQFTQYNHFFRKRLNPYAKTKRTYNQLVTLKFQAKSYDIEQQNVYERTVAKFSNV